jgi:hypothetical protein
MMRTILRHITLFGTKHMTTLLSKLVALAALAGSGVAATAATFSVDAPGKTVLFFDEAHGNQVEFYDQDGHCFLWYPGNRKAVPGRWVVNGPDICFQYGKNTYNPVTGAKGDDWSCSPIYKWKERVVDTVVGDTFSLSTTGVPYRLPAKPQFESVSKVEKFSP